MKSASADALASRTLGLLAFDHYLLCVHSKDASVADADWERLVEMVKEIGKAHGRCHVLVDTPGSGPNVMQRSLLNAVAKTFPMRAAVITDSMLAKTIVRAFGWMAVLEIKAFSPAERDAAHAYLGVTSERATLDDRIERLKRQVGR